MIYLDNAATSHFKPKAVFDAVLSELKDSSNSGRSGHSLAVNNALKNENCRRYLLEKLGAERGYNLVFTKNCTEALNLAIFGILNCGDSAIASCYEHNSVLRPLFELTKHGVNVEIINADIGCPVSFSDLSSCITNKTKLIVLNLVSNVTGTICDVQSISQKLSNCDCRPYLLIDGAQGVPIVDIDMTKMKIDMLAMPAHKGLHGTQGLGFLIFKRDIKLKPLLFGGTGTASDSVFQPEDAPEAFEAGTQFSAGIHALYEGAKWSFENVAKYREHIKSLATIVIAELKKLGAKVYSRDPRAGVVSFNLENFDSSVVADLLSKNYNIAVRSGLHCAPLVHEQLGTICGGAVRCSIGVDTTANEIAVFLKAVSEISKYKCEGLYRPNF